jgi:hypothetical protein
MTVNGNYQYPQPQQYDLVQPQYVVVQQVQEQKNPVVGVIAAGTGLYIGAQTYNFASLAIMGTAFASDTGILREMSRSMPALQLSVALFTAATIITGLAMTSFCFKVAQKNL